MGKWVYILALSAFLFSCSKDDGGGSDFGEGDQYIYEESDVAIGFSADGEWNAFTKSTRIVGNTKSGIEDSDDENSIVGDPSVTGFVAGDTIAVFGYYRQAGQEIGSVCPNFMYDQPVVFNGTNWYYSPIKYWPNDPSDKLDFYGYFPHSKELSVSSSNTVNAPPHLHYKLTETGGARIDFLYADTTGLSKPSVQEKTKLVFRHLMGKLQFHFSVLPPDGALDEGGKPITVNDGKYSAYVKSVAFRINTEGYFKYVYDTDSYPVWEVTALSRDLHREAVGTGIYVDTSEGEYLHEFTSFLLPVEINELNVGLSNDGGVTYITKELELTGENAIKVYAGKVTTVNVSIKQGKVITLRIKVQTNDWFEKQIEPTFPIY